MAIYAPPPEIPVGFDAEDYEEDPVELWEENLESFNFFAEICGTQWRVGMNGYTGLDYASVLACIRTMRLPREQADGLFSDVRAMERAALDAMRPKKT